MRQIFIALAGVVVWISFQTLGAFSLDLQEVNSAEQSETSVSKKRGRIPFSFELRCCLIALAFRLVRLTAGRATISGKLCARLRPSGYKRGKQLTREIWAALLETFREPALVEYTISANDPKGPFLEKVPAKMDQMQGFRRLNYSSPVEALAEKFHMSESLLKALNSESAFEAGQTIVVANTVKGSAKSKLLELKLISPSAFFVPSEKMEARWRFSRHSGQPRKTCAKRKLQNHQGRRESHVQI